MSDRRRPSRTASGSGKIHHLNRDSKNRPKKHGGGLIFGVAVLFLTLYMGGYIYTFATRVRIPETLVAYGSIEPMEVFSGVVVRDERVYRSGADGIVVFYVDNYEKLKAGGVACSVQDEKTVKKIEETLAAIEDNIISTQESRASYSIVENEKRASNAQIMRAADEAAMSINGLDIAAMYTLVEKVEQIMDYRNQLLFSENRGSVKTLVNDLTIFQNQLDNAVKPVTIDLSGIISYKTDGYEEILTVDSVKGLTKNQVSIDADYGVLEYSPYVSKGDPLFKSIESNNWYIAAYLPYEQAEGWTVNIPKILYLDLGGGVYDELDTTIYYLERNGNEVYAVFKCTKRLLDFADVRSVNFRLKKGLTEGLKIPNTAIVEKMLLKIPAECVVTSEKGLKYVLKLSADGQSFVTETISVFSETGPYVCIIMDYNGVKRGDVLSVPSETGETRHVREVEPIKGVYVTNSGAAVFRSITVSGENYYNQQYTVIDPALNPYIKVHDRIVSDVKYVDEKQMIY